MSIDTSELMEYFLDFSVVVTGFSRFDLQGTGQADLYFKIVREKIGEEIFEELLKTFHDLDVKAKRKYKPSILTEGLHCEILASGKFGSIARNIIKLWYVATWGENEEAFIASPQSYPEGLVWRTVGVNPPGAKAPGYATWSERPSVSLS